MLCVTAKTQADIICYVFIFKHWPFQMVLLATFPEHRLTMVRILRFNQFIVILNMLQGCGCFQESPLAANDS